MLRSVFPPDILAEIGRLQHASGEVGAPDDPMSPPVRTAASGLALMPAPGIRESRGSRFPALNLRTSALSLEIEAFMPGMSIEDLGLAIEGDVLVLSGERESLLPDPHDEVTVHTAERFSGRFRRVIGLPPDIDAQAISARYAMGVLTITVPRLQPVQAVPIAIQETTVGPLQ
jgi:HSP20 family protein